MVFKGLIDQMYNYVDFNRANISSFFLKKVFKKNKLYLSALKGLFV